MTTDWQKAQNVFPELKQIKAEWDSIHKAQVGHDSFAELTFCSKEVAKGLSDIITYANNVGAMFKQMSAYFALANVGLPGVSLHFKIQHQNEINDAFFLADALTKRGQHPELGNVAPPPVEGLRKDSSSVLCAFEKALAINKTAVEAETKVWQQAVKDGDAFGAAISCKLLEADHYRARMHAYYVAHLKANDPALQLVAPEDKHAVKDFDRRLPYEQEPFAAAAGIEAAVPGRLMCGTVPRALKCEQEVFENDTKCSRRVFER
eukprot:jgi/Astpho2/6052/Aster-x0713